MHWFGSVYHAEDRLLTSRNIIAKKWFERNSNNWTGGIFQTIEQPLAYSHWLKNAQVSSDKLSSFMLRFLTENVTRYAMENLILYFRIHLLQKIRSSNNISQIYIHQKIASWTDNIHYTVKYSARKEHLLNFSSKYAKFKNGPGKALQSDLPRFQIRCRGRHYTIRNIVFRIAIYLNISFANPRNEINRNT